LDRVRASALMNFVSPSFVCFGDPDICLDRVRASALMNFVFVSFEVACRILPLGRLSRKFFIYRTQTCCAISHKLLGLKVAP